MAAVTPPYLEFLRAGTDSHAGEDIATVTFDVAQKISDGATLERLAAGEWDHVDSAIDAQLDRIIAVCRGDIRLALYQLTITTGRAVQIIARDRS